MIVYIRSYICDYDSRINKFFSVMESKGVEYIYIGWDKIDAGYDPQPRKIIHRSNAPIGNRWKNFFAVLSWQIFVFQKLLITRARTKVVQCVDLDTALIGYVFCCLFGKKFVFDIYDQYSSSRGVTGVPARVMDWIERALAKRSSLCIVAAPERFAQHGLDPSSTNVMVLENVPQFDLSPVPLSPYRDVVDIGLFGVLESQHRGIETLLDLCDKHPDRVRLHVAGYGSLEKLICARAKVNPAIAFYGPLSSCDGLILMQRTHVMAGFYYLTNPNHYYAAPNKYFEHLMLGRGLLTTSGTPPGQRVKHLGTGWALAEGLPPLESWLASLNYEQIQKRAEIARRVWENHYSDYMRVHYGDRYVHRILNLEHL